MMTGMLSGPLVPGKKVAFKSRSSSVVKGMSSGLGGSG